LATKIRLMRMGKIRTPYYRIVVTDSRKARNGLSIEEIGRYSPSQEPSFIEVNSERALYWLGVGALPTSAVEAILKITGDWQKHKDLPGKEGTLRHAEPRVHKSVAYEAAVKGAMNEPKEGATTLKKKAQEKLAAKSAPAVEAVVETPTETPSAEVIEPTPVESVTTEAPAAEAPVTNVADPTALESEGAPAPEVTPTVEAVESATETAE
jgi:small subunit ribosomal protein S16